MAAGRCLGIRRLMIDRILLYEPIDVCGALRRRPCPNQSAITSEANRRRLFCQAVSIKSDIMSPAVRNSDRRACQSAAAWPRWRSINNALSTGASASGIRELPRRRRPTAPALAAARYADLTRGDIADDDASVAALTPSCQTPSASTRGMK